MSDSPSEHYTRLLLGKCYGYPLWDPQPTENNISYKKDGVRIGDVGFLDQGSFNYLFNICASRADPINSFLRKPIVRDHPFVPVPIDDDDVRHRRVAFPPEACVSTKSIRKRALDVSEQVEIGGAPLTQEILVQISCSSNEGAALILPNGASSQDLTPLARFRNHAHDYGTDWFNLLEKWGFAGRKIYLITGCHKSSAWGVTFSAARSTQGDVNMALGSCSIGGKIGYSWENSSDSESSHAGPLREPAEEDWGENQSVFIRGYIIVKRDRLLSLLRKPIEVKAIGGSPDIKSTIGRARPGNSPGTSSESHGSNASTSSRGGGGPSQSHLAISVERIPGTSVPSHPSNAIVDYLFAKAPDADFAIVHDDEWMGVLRPDEADECPPNEEIVDRVMQKYDVQVQGQSVFLTMLEKSDLTTEQQLIHPASNFQRPDSPSKRSRELADRFLGVTYHPISGSYGRTCVLQLGPSDVGFRKGSGVETYFTRANDMQEKRAVATRLRCYFDVPQLARLSVHDSSSLGVKYAGNSGSQSYVTQHLMEGAAVRLLRPELSQDMLQIISQLPPWSEESKPQYNDFFNSYGTHVVLGLALGGNIRIVVKNALDEHDRIRLSELGIEIGGAGSRDSERTLVERREIRIFMDGGGSVAHELTGKLEDHFSRLPPGLPDQYPWPDAEVRTKWIKALESDPAFCPDHISTEYRWLYTLGGLSLDQRHDLGIASEWYLTTRQETKPETTRHDSSGRKPAKDLPRKTNLGKVKGIFRNLIFSRARK